MTQTQAREDAVNPKSELPQLETLDSEVSSVATDEVGTQTAASDATDRDIVKSGKPYGRILLWVLGLLLLAMGGYWGDRWWKFQQTHVTTENAEIRGYVSPISAEIPATVQEILVKAGDSVKAGQVLLRLEDKDLQLKIQEAEAALVNAQAQLAGARDTVEVTRQINPTQVGRSQANLAASQSGIQEAQAQILKLQAQIKTKQAAVNQVQTEVTRTQADFQRYKFLYDEGAVSAQQFDLAQAAYNNAQAGLAAATQGVAQAQAELASGQAQLRTSMAQVNAAKGQVAETRVSGQNIIVQQDRQKQAQAQVQQAIATLALARQQLTYLEIKAPVSGYVGQLTAQLGQKAQAGQPLLSIVPLQTDRIYVEANFKETALAKLRVGEKAEIEVDAYPNETFPATVTAISPATGSSYALIAPDNATGNFNKVVQWVPVRLVFDADADPQHKLRLGLNVTAIVETSN
ncbi:HlyD family secretion protein [Spirulina sp. 06S082]|uniref:HlyD family secretion protein n=1 Tax=Spirulina sp. 06S082 TaxID=3110248 RepID=UPI002B2179C9|nr:HlyD family secretion protein [Spirulina sp. 06S082]MEA5471697.1 HlyD family secretion protein [Spirulina sp. 06S082]